MSNREVWVLEEKDGEEFVVHFAEEMSTERLNLEGYARNCAMFSGRETRVTRYVPEDELETLKRQLAESQELAARLQQDLEYTWNLINPVPLYTP
jgi:hypothetical protein